jgi:hypothetical protein
MASKMANAPARQVNVAGQEHSLAYINKSEARMLRRMGGSGKPGPSGIPTYYKGDPDKMKSTLDRYQADKDSGQAQKDFAKAAQAGKDTAAKAKANRIADAKKQLQDRIENQNVTGIGAYTPGGALINLGNAAQRGYMNRQLQDPNIVDVVFDEKGIYAGNVTKGLFGFNVYTGRQIAGYTGPYANIVAQDPTGFDKDDRVQSRIVRNYGGGRLSEDQEDGVNQELPDNPDAPGNVGDGDQTEEAKKKSSLGQESTVGTSPQGLLSNPRTRRRSLMSGLIQ